MFCTSSMTVKAVARDLARIGIDVEVMSRRSAFGKGARRPGTMRASTNSIWRAELSISARSLPKTLMPTGVRMPVESMSMRALIGIVQALDTPGNCSDLSISAISLSVVMPGRQSLFGLEIDDRLEHLRRRGSVAVDSAAGLAPDRIATSGKLLMILFCVCSSFRRLGHGQAGKSRRHVEEGALVERRHEFEPSSRRPDAPARTRTAIRWSSP